MARWRTTLIAAPLAALVAVGCTSGDDDGARTTSTTLLAPLPDEGVVVVEEWFDDADWVGRGDSPLWTQSEPDGSIVVLVPEGAEPGGDDAVVVNANPQYVVGPGVDEPGEFLPLGTPCGATSLVVESPGGFLRVASRATPLAELEQIGAALGVSAAGHVVVGDLDGWTEVGRLPVGWTEPPDGARARRHRTNLWAMARRLDPAELVALDMLVCDDPVADLAPPASQPADFLEPFGRRTVDVGGIEATVGAIGTYWLVAFTDDRLVLLDSQFLDELPDEVVRQLLAGMVALPEDEFDARIEDFEQRRGDEAAATFAEQLPPGEEVVAEGSLDGSRWVVHVAEEDEVGAVVCIDIVRGADGTGTAHLDDLLPHRLCPPDVSGQPRLAFGYSPSSSPTVLAFAEVPSSAVTVEVAGGGDVASALVDDERGRSYVLLSLLGQPEWVLPSGIAGEDVADILLASGGSATITVRDADGAVVAEDTIGG